MSLTVGIFESQDQAQGAIDRLVAAGVDEGDLHVLTRAGAERGDDSLFGVFARAFRGGSGAVAGELRRLGLGSEEAEFYDDELDEGSVLLAVQADRDRDDRVLAILREGDATLRES